MIHGVGSIFQNGKKVFEGEFQHGMMHGRGKFTFPSGNSFLGYFHKNQRRGPGKFVVHQPSRGLREVQADFGKKDQVRILSVTLAKDDDLNLNRIALQNNTFARNHLKQVGPFKWSSQKTMTVSQKQSLRLLEEFDQRMNSANARDEADSEDFDSEGTYTNSGSELQSDSDKGDSPDACGNFECSKSHWSSGTLESLRFGRKESSVDAQSGVLTSEFLKRGDAEDFLLPTRAKDGGFGVNVSFEELIEQIGLNGLNGPVKQSERELLKVE